MYEGLVDVVVARAGPQRCRAELVAIDVEEGRLVHLVAAGGIGVVAQQDEPIEGLSPVEFAKAVCTSTESIGPLAAITTAGVSLRGRLAPKSPMVQNRSLWAAFAGGAVRKQCSASASQSVARSASRA